MPRCHHMLLLAGILCLPGCFAMSIGGGGPKPITMAQEITELRKLRDRGTISSKEFEMGKLTLLQRYQPTEPGLVNPAETQLAEYPAPIEESRK